MPADLRMLRGIFYERTYRAEIHQWLMQPTVEPRRHVILCKAAQLGRNDKAALGEAALGKAAQGSVGLGGRADQPGSMPFALITASADGAARNLMKAFAASVSLLVGDAAAEK